jgi:phosphatidylglycerophosphate synthase
LLSSLSPFYPLKFAGLLGTIAFIAVTRLRAFHPYPRFGAANTVTSIRAALVAVVGAFIGETPTDALASSAVVIATIATMLDGVDGWLARRTAMSSAFGARFDMEIDALLIQILSILAWLYGKAGPWVLLSGLLRYAFWAAGLGVVWIRQPLFASTRRKTVCVVQIAGLLVALSPVVTPPWSNAVAAAALAALGYSFLVDTWWLWRRRQTVESL